MQMTYVTNHFNFGQNRSERPEPRYDKGMKETALPSVPVLTTEQILAELAAIDASRAARLESRAQEYFDSWEDGDCDA